MAFDSINILRFATFLSILGVTKIYFLFFFSHFNSLSVNSSRMSHYIWLLSTFLYVVGKWRCDNCVPSCGRMSPQIILYLHRHRYCLLTFGDRWLSPAYLPMWVRWENNYIDEFAALVEIMCGKPDTVCKWDKLTRLFCSTLWYIGIIWASNNFFINHFIVITRYKIGRRWRIDSRVNQKGHFDDTINEPKSNTLLIK